MLPNLGKRLSGALVQLLAARPQLTAKEIRSQVSGAKTRFSSAAVYKELKTLQEDGIVVKVGARFSLSLAWVFDQLAFGDQLRSTYFTERYLKTILPLPGEIQTWKFGDLLRCNDFWNQLLLALLGSTRTKEVFSWVPHPWFLLAQSEKEARLFRTFGISGRKFYTVFGGSGYLDRMAEKLYDSSQQVYSFAHSPFGSERAKYVDIIDCYALTVRLDTRTAGKIEKLFAATRSTVERTTGDRLKILRDKSSVSITLEHNERKATRIRNQFAEFFGLPIRAK